METVTDIGTAITDAELITAVNGHDPALDARPYWRDRACPSWCRMIVPHQDRDEPEGRCHTSPVHEVTLAAAHIDRIPSADGMVVLETSAAFITAGLLQSWPGTQARRRKVRRRVKRLPRGHGWISVSLIDPAELGACESGDDLLG